MRCSADNFWQTLRCLEMQWLKHSWLQVWYIFPIETETKEHRKHPQISCTFFPKIFTRNWGWGLSAGTFGKGATSFRELTLLWKRKSILHKTTRGYWLLLLQVWQLLKAVCSVDDGLYFQQNKYWYIMSENYHEHSRDRWPSVSSPLSSFMANDYETLLMQQVYLQRMTPKSFFIDTIATKPECLHLVLLVCSRPVLFLRPIECFVAKWVWEVTDTVRSNKKCQVQTAKLLDLVSTNRTKPTVYSLLQKACFFNLFLFIFLFSPRAWPARC